jgi:hypothetical protein
MVQEFKTKHGKLPTKITVTPIALALLSLRHSASVRCEGVPVESRLFDEQEVVTNGPNLGMFVYESGLSGHYELRGCDLA